MTAGYKARGEGTLQDPYMGHNINKVGKGEDAVYNVPTLAIFNEPDLSVVKARIREKLGAQQESYTASDYLLALLEQEISEETNRLFESEFSEGCSTKGEEGDYEDKKDEEKPKKNKKKVEKEM